ncbi:hypothetical protein [Streptomyces sp. SD15]
MSGRWGNNERDLLAESTGSYEAARAVLAERTRALEAVRSALAPIPAELVGKELEFIPVSRLKDVTEGRLRVAALEAPGFGSVRAVHERAQPLPGRPPGRRADQLDP